MDTHEGVTVSKVSKGHGGLTLILIFVPPNVISTVYVPSGMAGTQKNHPPTHTSTRSLAHTRAKTITLSAIQLYFQFFKSHRGA